MDRIEIYLLGTPRTYINGERYLFPYRRAEALFYYLVTEGSENKSILEDMFWGDIYDENRANRNYRNAVYRIRKDFGHDFLIRDGRQNLAVNPQADVWMDIREFHKDISLLGQADSLCYLYHFDVEHCARFEAYVTQKQQEYAEKIYNLLLSSYKTGDNRLMESICRKLITVDELCEKYYQLLLLVYGERNDWEMVRRTYGRLQKILMEELGVEPDEKITETYRMLEASILQKKKTMPLTENIPVLGYKNKGDAKERSKSILEWVSLFLDPVSFECLSSFVDMGEDGFDECVELLVHKSQLREEEQEGGIYYSVTRSELSESIYNKISLTRRRRMHREAARWLEGQFTASPAEELLPKLIYHFMKSGQNEKSDEYLNRYFYTYISVSHDFFPVLGDYPISYKTDTYVKNIREFNYIMQQMETYTEGYRDTVNPGSFSIDRVLLYSRMLLQDAVKKADYAKAWEYIHLLESYDSEYMEACRQKAYIYINICKAGDLLSLSEEMIALCKLHTLGQTGFWTRMKGMGLILLGRMEEGRSALLEAVSIFMDEGNRADWDTNAAVAYSWIGDSYRLERDYEDAGQYLLRSRKLTAKIHDVSGKTLIYLRIGQYYMDTGSRKEAEKYISASVKSFEWLGVLWKRSTAYGCAVLLNAEKGQWAQALENLEKQGDFATLVQDPYEKAFYYRNIQLLLGYGKCPSGVRRSLQKLSQSLTPPLTGGWGEDSENIPSHYEREYLQRLRLCNN